MVPRGIRNNNPGNIDRTGEKWQGEAEDQSSDPRFIVFTAPEWGIRAIAKVLETYAAKYELHTVKALISRWAPGIENDTPAYISAVAADAGVGEDEVVDLNVFKVMSALVRAIIHHENGEQPYAPETIAKGIQLAGIAVPQDAPQPIPQRETSMSWLSQAKNFIFNQVFASAARAAASTNQGAAASGSAALTALTGMASQIANDVGSGLATHNSALGIANTVVGDAETALKGVIDTYVLATTGAVPVVGGLIAPEAVHLVNTTLDYGEQHFLTYLSALFAHHKTQAAALTAPAGTVSNG